MKKRYFNLIGLLSESSKLLFGFLLLDKPYQMLLLVETNSAAYLPDLCIASQKIPHPKREYSSTDKNSFY